MKRFIPLLLTATVVLSSCSSTGGKKEATTPEKAQEVAVGSKVVDTADFTEGVTYADFTNTTDQFIGTLWFKADSKSDAGVVDIKGCDEEWESNGECKSGAKTVLPNVDLPGWRLWLASGATALEPNATAYLKFEVTGATGPVKFQVSTKEP